MNLYSPEANSLANEINTLILYLLERHANWTVLLQDDHAFALILRFPPKTKRWVILNRRNRCVWQMADVLDSYRSSRGGTFDYIVKRYELETAPAGYLKGVTGNDVGYVIILQPIALSSI